MFPLFEVREQNGERKVNALSTIEKGTELCTFTGKPIDFKETLKLGNKESFAFQVDKDLYIYLDEPYRYFNHSCEPNCGITSELKMVTLKPIEKNEELRWDYSTSMLEHHWTMKCNCKKENCRKIVGDFTTLPEKLQEHYLKAGVVQKFIMNFLKK
ncbi:MAG: SET domain-containing protein [Bacteroidetes bacterium]|nr:SET domain-containing protein [Bacteroidota bacterium]